MGVLGRRLAGVEARVVAVQELYRGVWVALCHLQVRLGRQPGTAERQRAIESISAFRSGS
jgi:hypothetical protein